MACSTTPRGLYKRGNVYYSRIAGVDGTLVRKRLSEDKQTAIIMLGEMRKQNELQKMGIVPETVEEEVKYCQQLKELYIARLRSLGRTQGTVAGFSWSWKYIVEASGAIRIEQITVAGVQKIADRLKAKGTRGQTINYYVNFVKDALDWARDLEYIRRNPLVHWEPVKRDAPRKRRDMTPAEIERFFAAETDEEYLLLWMLYFRTGLRASAGINVEWEWILWNEQALLLPAKANKSGVDHWIPLDATLFAALKKKRDALPEGAACGRIFAPIAVQTMRTRFRKICEKAGIDLDGLCLHSIRHTYATGSFEASGFNVKVVQELLCHSNAGTTMNYIHTSAQELRSTSEELAARFVRSGNDILKPA